MKRMPRIPACIRRLHAPFSLHSGRKGLLCLLLVGILGGCKPSLPSGVLSKSKMERMLYDFHMAQGMVDYVPREPDQSYDEIRYELHQAVFRKYGITQEDFDRSMSFYFSDLTLLAEIYKNVNERLEREAEALGVAAGPRDIYASLSAEGDTANVWTDRLIFALRNSRNQNFQNWLLECDSTWQAGDDLMWRFDIKQFSKSYSHGELYADLVVIYTNDSVRTRLNNINSQTDYELRVNNPHGWTPRTVCGHLFTPVTTDLQQLRFYIITSPSLIRFHKEVADIQQKDSVATDSIAADSTALEQVASDSVGSRRLSPDQFRDLQPVDRTIDVVKQKPYKATKRTGKKHYAVPAKPVR